jgi:hypothetical protein
VIFVPTNVSDMTPVTDPKDNNRDVKTMERLTAGGYTFSFYAKSDNPSSSFMDVSTPATFDSLAVGFQPTVFWERYQTNFTVVTPDWYWVGIYHFQNQNLYIDAVELERTNNFSNYGPITTVEAGLELTNNTYNTLFPADAKEVTVRLANNAATATNVWVIYEIFDLWNRRVADGHRQITVPLQGRTNFNIGLPLIGWQRIVTRLAGIPDSRDERTVTVLRSGWSRFRKPWSR